jgi:TatD DNase family protein
MNQTSTPFSIAHWQQE